MTSASGGRDPARNAYMSRVFDQMLGDLHYPQAKDGSIMDASAIKHWVAWHLVRCGWRKPNNLDQLALREEYDDPVIKKRKVPGPGVVEDAVIWVDFNESDDPLAGVEDMTFREIEQLPEELRAEAKRRLGLAAPLPEPPVAEQLEAPWQIQPHVTITDAPYVDDNTAWTREEGECK